MEPFRFDAALKEIFRGRPKKLLEALIGTSDVVEVSVELPTVKRMEMDFLYRRPDGSHCQFEFQGPPFENMDQRMLEYRALGRGIHKATIHQYVICLGRRPPRMTAEIREPGLWFTYEVVELTHFPGESMVESDSWADNVLAVMCDLKDVRAALRTIREKWRVLPATNRADLEVKTLILSSLEGREELVKEEFAMEIDVLEIPLFRRTYEQGAEKGRHEGQADGERRLLGRMLTKRFGVLPEWAEARLSEAAIDQIERWSDRLLQSSTLEEALG